MGAVSSDPSFNIAVSFVTNTDWQRYGGEATLSYLAQMLGLTIQNFISATSSHWWLPGRLGRQRQRVPRMVFHVHGCASITQP